MAKRYYLWVLWLAVTFSASVTNERAAHANEMAPAHQAAVLLKVLSFDRNLRSNTKGSLVIGVVYNPSAAGSISSANAVSSAFRRFTGKLTVQGMRFSVVSVGYDSQTFAANLAKLGVTAIYVSRGLDTALSAISRVARQKRSPTMAGSRGLARSGVAVAIVRRGARAGIVINLRASRRLGMNLPPALLRLSEVIK